MKACAHRGHVYGRHAALEVLRAAATCIKSTEAVKAEVVKVQKILDGSAEGRIKNASERAALVASLTAFCTCPPADAAMQELAEETAEYFANYFQYVPYLQLLLQAHSAALQCLHHMVCLITWCASLTLGVLFISCTKQSGLGCGRDEANDDVKNSLLVAIGSWLKLGNNLPAAVSSRLALCLKEKDSLKTSALTATLQVSFWFPSVVFQCCKSLASVSHASASHVSASPQQFTCKTSLPSPLFPCQMQYPLLPLVDADSSMGLLLHALPSHTCRMQARWASGSAFLM